MILSRGFFIAERSVFLVNVYVPKTVPSAIHWAMSFPKSSGKFFNITENLVISYSFKTLAADAAACLRLSGLYFAFFPETNQADSFEFFIHWK